VAEFNTLRPHEALGMQTPASVCAASPRRFTGLPELAYPFHDRDAIVAGNGSIRLHSRTVVISSVFAGQRLGLREVDTDVWPVSFMHYDLRWRYEACKPSTPRSARECHPCDRYKLLPMSSTGDT
jgi:hypothetical protein